MKQLRLSEFVLSSMRNDWRNHSRARGRRMTRRARATVRRVMFGFKDVCSYKNILQIFEFADAVDDEQLLYENLNHAFPTRGLDCAIAVISEPCYYMQWIERMKHRSRTCTRTRVVKLHRTTPLRRITCTKIVAFFRHRRRAARVAKIKVKLNIL